MKQPDKTDWDSYYEKVPFTAKITRGITSRLIVRILKEYGLPSGAAIAEPGGANSCFVATLFDHFAPQTYTIIDSNKTGLDKYKNTNPLAARTTCLQADILDLAATMATCHDLVFSVGLIEHFSVDQTRQAVQAHFDLACDEGLVLLLFPTPTPVYRLTRFLAERLGLWHFPDERPLGFEEVRAAIAPHGEILYETTNHKIILAQGVILTRKMASQK